MTDRLQNTHPESTLSQLESVIASRWARSPDQSYVACLLHSHEDRLLKKVGEEAAEVMLAAKSGDREPLVRESADLLFHLLVVLVRYGCCLQDVLSVLQSRRGCSGSQEERKLPHPV